MLSEGRLSGVCPWGCFQGRPPPLPLPLRCFRAKGSPGGGRLSRCRRRWALQGVLQGTGSGERTCLPASLGFSGRGPQLLSVHPPCPPAALPTAAPCLGVSGVLQPQTLLPNSLRWAHWTGHNTEKRGPEPLGHPASQMAAGVLEGALAGQQRPLAAQGRELRQAPSGVWGVWAGAGQHRGGGAPPPYTQPHSSLA
ncbi:hypothetical protein HJG60_011652 [Phyllostomus discolor]|uniref:Uncharacterized protein n=1 Tax=Phyllostomus discolor TaxID=89673 RepID=A0A834E1C2_9CHIR|nr:hypothetical protein HJG60_011652 [Phyllostomus discolor]